MDTVTQVAKETAIEGFLTRLSSQNSRFISNLQQLEKYGHKLVDTNTPEKESNGAEPHRGQGILHEIDRHLDYYTSHNVRLENILQKLSELI
jgi:hypothetical protein